MSRLIFFMLASPGIFVSAFNLGTMHLMDDEWEDASAMVRQIAYVGSMLLFIAIDKPRGTCLPGSEGADRWGLMGLPRHKRPWARRETNSSVAREKCWSPLCAPL